MFKIEHSATNCAYFSKNVHMQEFAFDTICVCTWWQACSEHACFERLYGLSTSACTYALKVLSRWHSGSEIWQTMSGPETCRIAEKSIFPKNRDFWRFWRFQGLTADLAKISVWRQSWLDLAKPASLAGPGQMAVRTNRSLAGWTWPNWQVWQDLPKSRFFGFGPAKPGSRCLYIDHFQLPPRWKMTGEDGDPFRKSRWHWPSKRRDFEKNLLITKSLI